MTAFRMGKPLNKTNEMVTLGLKWQAEDAPQMVIASTIPME